MAKYDFSKVSREALEAFCKCCMPLDICPGNLNTDFHRDEVLRQARVRTPEEVALELAEYCCNYLCPEVGLVENNKIPYREGCKIRRLTDEYRKLVVHH